MKVFGLSVGSFFLEGSILESGRALMDKCGDEKRMAAGNTNKTKNCILTGLISSGDYQLTAGIRFAACTAA